MKKTLYILFFIPFYLLGQDYANDVGYINIDSATFVDTEFGSQTYAYDSSNHPMIDDSTIQWITATQLDDTTSDLRTDLMRKDALQDSLRPDLTLDTLYLDSINATYGRIDTLWLNGQSFADTILSHISDSGIWITSGDSVYLKSEFNELGVDTVNIGLGLFSDKVGIGKTNPFYTLDVTGTIKASSYIWTSSNLYMNGSLSNGSTGLVKIYFGSAAPGGAVPLKYQSGQGGAYTGGSHIFEISGVQVFKIDSPYIAIGIHTPLTYLHNNFSESTTTPVLADGIAVTNDDDATTGNISAIILGQKSTGLDQGARIIGVHSDRTGGSRNTDLGLYVLDDSLLNPTILAYNDSLKFYIDSTEKMRLNSTGLGIGIDNPNYKLDIVGDLRATFASNMGKLIIKNTDYSDIGSLSATTTYAQIIGGIDATGQDAAFLLRNEETNYDWAIWNKISNSDALMISNDDVRAGDILRIKGTGTFEFLKDSIFFGSANPDTIVHNANKTIHKDTIQAPGFIVGLSSVMISEDDDDLIITADTLEVSGVIKAGGNLIKSSGAANLIQLSDGSGGFTTSSGFSFDGDWLDLQNAGIIMVDNKHITIGGSSNYITGADPDVSNITIETDTFIVNNQAKIDGNLYVNGTLELSHSVWKSWDVDPTIWSHPGANSMDLSNEDNFAVLDADKATDESINYIWEIPAQYNPGDSCHIHLNYFVDGACVLDTSIVFGLEYKLLAEGNAFDFTGTTTILDTAVFTCSAKEILNQNGNLLFVPTNFEHEKHILIRLYRDADNGEDNYNGDLRIFSIHVDYKANRIGE